VKKDSVRGVNAFNRRIAEQRLERTFQKAICLPRDYMSGLKYEGIVVHLAGDTFSGDIHEELARTNEATPLETLLYWLDPFVAGFKMLADQYDKVHVVSVPGNHDRTTRKPVMKGRVETSLHYLFSKLLEREFKGDDRITWDIPQSPDAMTVVYNTRILTTHGDQFRGGGGIGGILIPILRGDAKKRQRQQAVGEPYDLMVLGHFHQYIAGPGVLINGSLKGYDEYAFQNNFAYEAPQQALFLVTPEHGPNFYLPIQCANKREERW
jgi:predicted phosphodiesterase